MIQLILYAILVILLVSLFWNITKSWYIDYRLRDFPSPPKLPVVGHILRFSNPEKILDEILSIQQEYGGVVKLQTLFYYTLMITDYKFLEFLFNGNKILDKSAEYSFFTRWLGTGLLTSAPEKWRKRRKVITPTFHFQILEEFIEVFHKASDILLNKLESEVGKPSTDIYPYITLCTLDVICESAMGTSVKAQECSDSLYVRGVQEMSAIMRRRIFSPIKMFDAVYFFSRDYWKERSILKIIHGYTNNVIKSRKRELCDKMNSFQNGFGKRRLAFLDLLLQSTIDGRPLADDEIREEVDTFMFEGHDTTSSALSLCLFCLANNMEIQDKVVEELKTVFSGDKNRMATYSELQNMKYLEMVIKETLRLYPSVPFFARKVEKDTEYCGITLPKGVTLNIIPYSLHRNPRIYPDPEKFDPERFTTENQQKRRPFSYIPFSAGSRNCIGQKFAMLEMKAVLAKLLRSFEFSHVPGFQPVLLPDMILKFSNGIRIQLKSREF